MIRCFTWAEEKTSTYNVSIVKVRCRQTSPHYTTYCRKSNWSATSSQHQFGSAAGHGVVAHSGSGAARCWCLMWFGGCEGLSTVYIVGRRHFLLMGSCSSCHPKRLSVLPSRVCGKSLKHPQDINSLLITICWLMWRWTTLLPNKSLIGCL